MIRTLLLLLVIPLWGQSTLQLMGIGSNGKAAPTVSTLVSACNVSSGQGGPIAGCGTVGFPSSLASNAFNMPASAVIVCVITFDNNSAVSSFGDTGSTNVFTLATTLVVNNNQVTAGLYYKLNSVAVSNDVLTLSTGGTNGTIGFSCSSISGTGGTVDSNPAGLGTGTSGGMPITGPSVTTTHNVEVIIQALSLDRVAVVSSNTAGYTVSTQDSAQMSSIAYKVTSSTVSGEAMSWNCSTSAWWGGNAISFF